VHDLLLQKSSGTFELVVWDERPLTQGSDAVTVEPDDLARDGDGLRSDDGHGLRKRHDLLASSS
jgi:hypothetical protein